MKLKGMPDCFLCDGCGALNNRKDVSVSEAGMEFCSVWCAEKGKGQPAAARCWVCAKKLDEPILYYWHSIVGAKYLPVFCSLDCRQGYERDAQKGKGPGWISVDERLPEENKRVLLFWACSEMSFVGVGWGQATGKGWEWGDWRWIMQGGAWYDKHDVTHWQPLPEPPVVEQKREVGQCRDCRNWGQFVGEDSSYGGCALAHLARQRAQGWIQLDGGVFATRFNFGCVAFEPKGEA